jgi:hypothetical protein
LANFAATTTMGSGLTSRKAASDEPLRLQLQQLHPRAGLVHVVAGEVKGGPALGVVEDAAAAAAASSGSRAWPGPLTAEVIKARFYAAMAQHHQAEQHQ